MKPSFPPFFKNPYHSPFWLNVNAAVWIGIALLFADTSRVPMWLLVSNAALFASNVMFAGYFYLRHNRS